MWNRHSCCGCSVRLLVVVVRRRRGCEAFSASRLPLVVEGRSVREGGRREVQASYLPTACPADALRNPTWFRPKADRQGGIRLVQFGCVLEQGETRPWPPACLEHLPTCHCLMLIESQPALMGQVFRGSVDTVGLYRLPRRACGVADLTSSFCERWHWSAIACECTVLLTNSQ